MTTKEDLDLLSKGGREIIDILKDLDNPSNIIYKSGVHALVLRSYVKIVYGKNPNGSNSFKFELSKEGERIVNRFDQLIQEGGANEIK